GGHRTPGRGARLYDRGRCPDRHRLAGAGWSGGGARRADRRRRRGDAGAPDRRRAPRVGHSGAGGAASDGGGIAAYRGHRGALCGPERAISRDVGLRYRAHGKHGKGDGMKRRGAGTIGTEDVGNRVKLQAWVQRRRDHGGLVFLDLRDRSGIVQVVLRPEERPDAAQALAAVRSEWVVEVEGEVVRRGPEHVNRDLPTGEIEVVADRAAALSRSEPPPFPLDGKTDAAEETRLHYRYLDLRRT